MKEIKNTRQKSIFKKLFVKLCRLMGYEIIDQNDVSFPVSEKENKQELSIINKRSITLPLGETKISRKVKTLDLFIKTCTSVNLVTQNKKRIFESDKSEYTFRTLNSLKRNISFILKNTNQISIKIYILDQNSYLKDLEIIKSIFEELPINFELIKLENEEFPNIKVLQKNNNQIEKNMKSTMISILKSFQMAKDKSEDLIYFVEDDYIHEEKALYEMVLTYEKISSQVGGELFLCPVDYPYLYKKAENTNILIGNNYHWRTIKESLLTFMTSKQMLLKHFEELNLMASKEHEPFETPLHKIYENELCLSPVPSLAMHCTNINSVFGLSPNLDWKKIWEENKI